MKKIYKVTIIKNGVNQVQNRLIDGDIDEMHIVSMKVIKKDLEKEMEEIVKANSFKQKYLPAIVFFGSLFLMGLIVLKSWGLI